MSMTEIKVLPAPVSKFIIELRSNEFIKISI